METIQRDYAPKGVKFYYIYKALAHPETNGYVSPVTLQERLMHVAEARKKLGTRFEWICDSMTNDLKHALGDAPNSEFLIDPQGRILVARAWSSPSKLRGDLAERLGDVEPRTTLADIGMKPLAPPATAPKGVVPRVELPGQMSPVIVSTPRTLTLPGAEPYYVKLRAEVDAGYSRGGAGTLYLGFFLDPLYQVHWNNKVAPIEFEIKAPSGVTVTPTKGAGPQVASATDADPREFLLRVDGRSREPLLVTVRYFACDDAETFCKAVTQHYEVTLQRDRDGGSRRAGRGNARFRAGRPPGARPFGPPANLPNARSDPERRARLKRAASLFRLHDTNRDGKITADEWPDPPKQIERGDDNAISLEELLDFLKRE